ncbi:MAG: hypothetical protein IT225_02705 [Flavobacteriales bacterium]|jgi:uncharacterized delta-60 repeat protein|nr:hypothetical protein [Flavobacteriales bacterium]
MSAKAQQFVPDLQFGEQGISVHDAPSGVSLAAPISLHRLPDGKFLMGFMVGNDGGLLSLHLPNGERDTAFGNDGIRYFPAPDGMNMYQRDVAVTADGRIVVLNRRQAQNGYTMAFQFNRLLPDGTPDATFGDGGMVVMPGPDNMALRSVIALPDGKILFGGMVNGALMVGRLEQSGVLDSSFGNNGIALHASPNVGMSLSRMRLAPNGEIFVVGSQLIGFDATGLAVCKVLSNGALDTSFGDNGYFLHDQSENLFLYESLHDLHIGADGSLIIAGSIALDGIKERYCILKLRPDGTVDQAFGEAGMVLHGTLTTDRNLLQDIAFDPRGFYVLFGTLVRNFEVTRSMYTFMDASGAILTDPYGETDHIISGPDVPEWTRRMVLDESGGFIEGIGFSFRPIGISALRRFAFSSPTAVPTAPSANGALRAWPNPTSGTLNVHLADPIDQGTTITVMDPVGRVVADERSMTWSFSGERSITLDLPNSIAEGRYSLVLTTDADRRMVQFVVQR